MKKIYLACPYSDPDPEVRERRFRAVNAKAGELMAKGFLVFSPISHTHPIAVQCELPKGWEFWAAYDRTFIEWCEEVHVLMLDGWQKSVGVKAEIRIAMELKLNKPVFFIEP